MLKRGEATTAEGPHDKVELAAQARTSWPTSIS